MSNISSSLGTATTAIPIINQTQLGQAAGVAMHFPTFSAFTNAVTIERANVIASNPLWADGQPMSISGEPMSIRRLWSVSLNHARTILLNSVTSVILGADSNVVIATSGVPASSLGNNGDLALDVSANLYYVKTAGSWSSGVASLVTLQNNLSMTAIYGSTTPGTYSYNRIGDAIRYQALQRDAVNGGGCSVIPSSVDYLHQTKIILGGYAAGLFACKISAGRNVIGIVNRTTKAFTTLTGALSCTDGTSGTLQSASANVSINAACAIDAQNFFVVTTGSSNYNGIIYKISCSDALWASSATVTATPVCYLGLDDVNTLAAVSTTSLDVAAANGCRALTDCSIAYDSVNGIVYFNEYNAQPGTGGTSGTAYACTVASGASGTITNGLASVWAGNTGNYVVSFYDTTSPLTKTVTNTRRCTLTSGSRDITNLTTPLTITAASVDAHNQTRMRVLKSTANGAAGSWSIIFTQNGDPTKPCFTRHGHACQLNPYTGDLVLSWGDSTDPALNGFSTSDAGLMVIDVTKTFDIPSNTDWAAIKAAAPLSLRGLVYGFFARNCGVVFQPDGYFYGSSDSGPTNGHYKDSGIIKYSYDGNTVSIASRRGMNYGWFDGFMGKKDDAGNMLFTTFADTRPADGTPSQYLYIHGGQKDGTNFSAVAAVGCFPTSANPTLASNLVWDTIGQLWYFTCSAASGKGTSGDYNTSVFATSTTPNVGEPEVIGPIYYVNPVTGTDDTAADTVYGQRGWGRGNPWRTASYALTGNRVTHGAIVRVLSPADYLVEDSAAAATYVSGGYTYASDKFGATPAWNAMASMPGTPMTPVVLDWRELPGYVRICQNSTAGTGFKAWLTINPATMAFRVLGGRHDFVEVDNQTTPTKGVNASSTILYEYYNASAPINGSALIMDRVVTNRYTKTQGSTNSNTRVGSLVYHGGGLLKLTRCNVCYIAFPAYVGPNAGVSALVQIDNCGIWNVGSVVNEASTTRGTSKYEITNSYIFAKATPLTWQTVQEVYPDQFTFRNTAILIEGNTTANGLTIVGGAGATASFTPVAQTLTITGHQSVTNYLGATKIIGGKVTATAGAVSTFAATDVGRYIMTSNATISTSSVPGIQGLMQILSVDATGAIATCKILKPMTNATLTASQWSIVNPVNPIMYNCISNVHPNWGGYWPWPEPDTQPNLYPVPNGVVSAEGVGTPCYWATSLATGNFSDPNYPSIGPSVLLPSL